MLIMDMPNVPPQAAPVLMQIAAVAQKTPSKPDSESLYGSMGVCMVSPTLEKMGIGTDPLFSNGMPLYPQSEGLRRLPGSRDNVDLQEASTHASVQILQQPEHGVIVSKDNESFYVPNQGYVGNDKVVFLVNIDGRIVKTVYYLKVIDVKFDFQTINALFKKYCPAETDWQISSNTTEGNAIVSNFAQNLLSSFATSGTSTLLSTGVTLTVADLPGGAVGETTGTSITLDSNAAGYGWYVDPNPSANTDFLPTSNPDVWMAKAGSAAAGKMDMLSVLLHEYGHALGLEHSANPNDFMAPDLQPGERRLPSSDELALLSQLATQLASGNSTPNIPTSPALPVGTALSALLIGRLRRTDYGAWSPVIDNVQIPAPIPQLELAVNPTLVGLGSPIGWTTNGNVTTDSTGTATLKNSTGADAQLAQAFNIISQDRFVEFTLTNGLQKGSGPADAFEVAFDNAVTGTALVGTDGLTNSDGLLNIQADGTTHAASPVYKSVNADGEPPPT